MRENNNIDSRINIEMEEINDNINNNNNLDENIVIEDLKNFSFDSEMIKKNIDRNEYNKKMKKTYITNNFVRQVRKHNIEKAKARYKAILEEISTKNDIEDVFLSPNDEKKQTISQQSICRKCCNYCCSCLKSICKAICDFLD